MEKILGYFTEFGFSVFVIACCVITFIGILKLCKVFDKITNKDVKKCIYYALNIALSFAGAAIYFAIFGKPFSTYILFSCSQVSVTTLMYSIYEHFGLRKVVQLLLGLFAKWFKSNPENKLVKDLKKIGLTDTSIATVQNIVQSEKERAEQTTVNTENK